MVLIAKTLKSQKKKYIQKLTVMVKIQSNNLLNYL